MGDYYGGMLNPAFALFSFVALLATIVLQVNELSDQRKDFRQSLEEMKESKIAQQISAEQMKLQNQLQFHAVRVDGPSSLINTMAVEAQHSLDAESKQDALEELEVYTRELNAELEAVSSLVDEARDRVRQAELDLYGYSDQ